MRLYHHNVATLTYELISDAASSKTQSNNADDSAIGMASAMPMAL